MHDLREDRDSVSTYECLRCGELVTTDTRPDACPNCGQTGSYRNRAMSLE
ncbi:rubrerythrin-like domain-containing protein [Natrinema salifodinae]|uniref:DUF7129 domain-containing protein n=1 Tax=Natrinema salifodinae TaxID=1202768 RepID=A0A1I0MKR8_9EURY|nr:rubrerythrin-like domain-containing protein [Natrinema salifodinae]SEV88460.1 hypothetical protein SAMN05216285_1049 [Natrinema salifodinae]